MNGLYLGLGFRLVGVSRMHQQSCQVGLFRSLHSLRNFYNVGGCLPVNTRTVISSVDIQPNLHWIVQFLLQAKHGIDGFYDQS
eukprot:scaffold6986_cov190-Amphora_coffeaeformis.AAC.7